MIAAAALRDLQAALGARHVSSDPGIVAGYAWHTGFGDAPSTKKICSVRPAAITLPGSTEEVQAVVQTCLRHGLRFRATSTGHASYANVSTDRTVLIDLRRMNRIVELDAAHQMAVIEPYVTAGQLQIEAMRHGLTPHIVGAGWTHSPLASATSLAGIGISGHHTSQNNRNLLAWEWVTPEGEIVRAGSAGADAGWFAGEGPGPGFRGMLRGQSGALGGLGVFTRIGYKLHPWAGPSALEHTGTHPQWGMKLSDTMRLYQVRWDDWSGPTEAMYEFMLSGAPTFVVRIPSDQYGWTLSPTNRDFYDQLTAGTLPEIARDENRISWTVLCVSASKAEAEWRDRTVRAVVEKTRGRLLDLASDHAEIVARNVVTSCYVPRALRGGLCGTGTSFGVSNSFALLPQVVATGERLMAPYKKPGGSFVSGPPEEFWIWSTEGRHLWAENIAATDNQDVDRNADTLTYFINTLDENDQRPLGTSGFMAGTQLSDMYGPRQGRFNDWSRQVKQVFDPANAADGFYVDPEPFKMGRFWPWLRRVFKVFPFLLHRTMRKAVLNGK
jgi:glycolate oxidase